MDYDFALGGMSGAAAIFFLYKKMMRGIETRANLDAKAEEIGKQCMENILSIAHYESERKKWGKILLKEIKNPRIVIAPPNFYNKKMLQRYFKNNPGEKDKFARDFEMYAGMLRMRERDIERAREEQILIFQDKGIRYQ